MSQQPFSDFVQYLLADPARARALFADKDALEAHMAQAGLSADQRAAIHNGDEAASKAHWESENATPYMNGINFR